MPVSLIYYYVYYSMLYIYYVSIFFCVLPVVLKCVTENSSVGILSPGIGHAIQYIV